MKTKLSQEYEQEREVIGYEQEQEAIGKKYKEKLRNCFIGLTAASILTCSSLAVENIKLKNLEKNYPIHQEYTDNQNSLRYLRNKLNQHKSERFPEFLSKDIKNELENIGVQPNLAKISSLEKVVKIAEQDSIRIVNTPEFKEYSEKRERGEIFYWLRIGFLLTIFPGFIFLSDFYRGRRDKELKALEKY